MVQVGNQPSDASRGVELDTVLSPHWCLILWNSFTYPYKAIWHNWATELNCVITGVQSPFQSSMFSQVIWEILRAWKSFVLQWILATAHVWSASPSTCKPSTQFGSLCLEPSSHRILIWDCKEEAFFSLHWQFGFFGCTSFLSDHSDIKV